MEELKAKRLLSQTSSNFEHKIQVSQPNKKPRLNPSPSQNISQSRLAKNSSNNERVKSAMTEESGGRAVKASTTASLPQLSSPLYLSSSSSSASSSQNIPGNGEDAIPMIAMTLDRIERVLLPKQFRFETVFCLERSSDVRSYGVIDLEAIDGESEYEEEEFLASPTSRNENARPQFCIVSGGTSRSAPVFKGEFGDPDPFVSYHFVARRDTRARPKDEYGQEYGSSIAYHCYDITPMPFQLTESLLFSMMRLAYPSALESRSKALIRQFSAQCRSGGKDGYCTFGDHCSPEEIDIYACREQDIEIPGWLARMMRAFPYFRYKAFGRFMKLASLRKGWRTLDIARLSLLCRDFERGILSPYCFGDVPPALARQLQEKRAFFLYHEEMQIRDHAEECIAKKRRTRSIIQRQARARIVLSLEELDNVKDLFFSKNTWGAAATSKIYGSGMAIEWRDTTNKGINPLLRAMLALCIALTEGPDKSNPGTAFRIPNQRLGKDNIRDNNNNNKKKDNQILSNKGVGKEPSHRQHLGATETKAAQRWNKSANFGRSFFHNDHRVQYMFSEERVRECLENVSRSQGILLSNDAPQQMEKVLEFAQRRGALFRYLPKESTGATPALPWNGNKAVAIKDAVPDRMAMSVPSPLWILGQRVRQQAQLSTLILHCCSRDNPVYDEARYQAALLTCDESQRRALEHIMKHPFTLITGPPGSGKSHVLRAAMECFKPEEVRVCTPYGNMSNTLLRKMGGIRSCKHEISTFHSTRKTGAALVSTVFTDEVTCTGLENYEMLEPFAMAGGFAKFICAGDPNQISAYGNPCAALLKRYRETHVHCPLTNNHRLVPLRLSLHTSGKKTEAEEAGDDDDDNDMQCERGASLTENFELILKGDAGLKCARQLLTPLAPFTVLDKGELYRLQLAFSHTSPSNANPTHANKGADLKPNPMPMPFKGRSPGWHHAIQKVIRHSGCRAARECEFWIDPVGELPLDFVAKARWLDQEPCRSYRKQAPDFEGSLHFLAHMNRDVAAINRLTFDALFSSNKFMNDKRSTTAVSAAAATTPLHNSNDNNSNDSGNNTLPIHDGNIEKAKGESKRIKSTPKCYRVSKTLEYFAIPNYEAGFFVGETLLYSGQNRYTKNKKLYLAHGQLRSLSGIMDMDASKRPISFHNHTCAPLAPNAIRVYIFADGSTLTSGMEGLSPEALPNAFARGYASTVHSSQGDEYKTVVFIVSDYVSPYFDRKHFYTAVTRCTQHVILVTRIDNDGALPEIRKIIAQNEEIPTLGWEEQLPRSEKLFYWNDHSGKSRMEWLRELNFELALSYP